MKKIILVLFTVASALLFSACGNKDADQSAIIQNYVPEEKPLMSFQTYGINAMSYKNNKITIRYPSIVKMSDSSKQSAINDLIKAEALKVINRYGSADNLNLNVNFDISLGAENLLSIQYTGYCSGGKTTSNNLFYTTNIDLTKGAVIKLPDMININKGFVEKFRGGTYIAQTNADNIRMQSALNYILENSSANNMVGTFTNADLLDEKNSANIFCYLTKDSLGISMGVPQEYGEHQEFELKYQDVKSFIKTNNAIWKGIIAGN